MSLSSLGRSVPLAPLALGLAIVVVVACPAPQSRPLEGEAGEAVRTALLSGDRGFDHSTWNVLLAAATVEGLSDYAVFRARHEDLESYLHQLAGVDLSRLSSPHLEALLLNAYNAMTVDSILAHPDVSSIKEIPGVWDKTKHRLGGFDLTLDQIEHNLLRPFFKDPRIHFAVNCASLSCAPLPPWAYDGDALEEQLEERSRTFLSDPRNVRLEGGELRLSRYLDWYGNDFTASDWQPRADTLSEFVGRYTTPEIATALQSGTPDIAFLDYDWTLNSATRAPPQ